jgi:hypothetical protein
MVLAAVLVLVLLTVLAVGGAVGALAVLYVLQPGGAAPTPGAPRRAQRPA